MFEFTQNKVLIIALFSAAIAIIVFSNSDTQTPPKKHVASTDTKPEAFIEGAQFQLYDKQGFSTTLKSKTAYFYQESDHVDIEAPHATVSSENGSVIELTAATGKLSPKTEELSLNGSVLIKQVFPADKVWSMRGEEFLIDNKQRFISSDQAVTIQKGESTMQAIGLNAYLDEKRIELLSKVRGQYALSQ
jgi:lipopolysaccharide export system protein LptC